jgi:RNA polymerase sigma-70 factor, ECF subfamily
MIYDSLSQPGIRVTALTGGLLRGPVPAKMGTRWSSASPMPSALSQGPEEDLALLTRARKGEPESVRVLADRLTCVPRILGFLNHRLGRGLSEHDVEDLSQEVTLLVLGKLAEYRPIGTLEAWVYRICTLQMMNARRRAATRRYRQEQLASRLLDETESNEDMLRTEVIETALRGLDPEREAVIRLKHFEGLSFTQIGERLHLSPNTLKSRYYRGLDAMRRSLPASITAEDLS